MNKLTAEKCRELIEQLKDKQAHPRKGLAGDEKMYLQALEIALPILEQQEQGEGDWVEWGGGECPVDVNRAVEVRLMDGTVSSTLPTDGWVWEHGLLSPGADIIAYRIIPERATNQNGEQ